MKLADVRFTECGYFYKLKEDEQFSGKEIHRMMVDVTNGKIQNYLFDLEREDDGNGTRFSLRVFKQKINKPSFFVHPENGWEELKVGYFLFIECDRYVVVLRRNATIPKWVSDKLENVDYTTLLSLEAKPDSVFRKLSMQNLDGSDYAMRNRTYESLDLSSNISTIGISRYYVRSVTGNNTDGRFSLTLGSSRINEFGADLTVSDVCGWVRRKVDLIGAIGVMPDTLLSAFAKPEKYSTVYDKLEPQSLLIYYGLIRYLKDEQQAQFYHTKGNEKRKIDEDVLERYIERISRAYTNIKAVNREGNKYFYTGHNDAIELRLTKSGIKLCCKTWKNIEIEGSQDDIYNTDLQSLINTHHEFNVYFTDNELIYANKTLFRDTRLIASIPHFLKVLQEMPSLDHTKYEKHPGKSPKKLKDWNTKSIFKAVEKIFMPQYTHFICDDCNDEWADHIGIYQGKVSFFVSKHNDSNDSASDFQDVVGQALKNLGNLTPTTGQLEKKQVSWSGKYQTSQMDRLRSNNGNVQDAVTMWGDNVMNPNYVREMCLVVDFLSKKTFSKQLDEIANNRPVAHESELRQRLWILSSFVNGCLECGVKPVIYCKS